MSKEPLTWALGIFESLTSDSNNKRMEDTFQLLLPSKEPFCPPTSVAKALSPGEVGYLLPGQRFTFLVQFCPGTCILSKDTVTIHAVMVHIMVTCRHGNLLCFNVAHHGRHAAQVPLFLNGHTDHPYKVFEFSGNVPPSRITTSPLHIVILPIPLEVTVEAEFIVNVEGLPR